MQSNSGEDLSGPPHALAQSTTCLGATWTGREGTVWLNDGTGRRSKAARMTGRHTHPVADPYGRYSPILAPVDA